jgi:predicted PurR-regulated permease PerM
MTKKIEISHRTIIFAFLLGLGIWFVSQIVDIVIMVFVALILVSALNPFVDKLESLKIPRGLAIVLIYIVLWGVVGALVASIIPGLLDQTSKLIRILPAAINNIDLFTSHQQEISQQLLTRIGTLPENLLKITLGIFGNILDVLTTIVMAFYMLLYHKHISTSLESLFGSPQTEKISQIVYEIERRLGSWVRGELFLMLIIGVLTYIGLVFLGIEIALPLAVLAGILEIVPNIGPIISSIPAIIIALTVHPIIALATAAWYFIVQFLENHLVVPKVMQHAIGVNPLISIIGLMIGFKLAGPVGAILALPIVIIVQTLGLGFFSIKNLEALSEKA